MFVSTIRVCLEHFYLYFYNVRIYVSVKQLILIIITERSRVQIPIRVVNFFIQFKNLTRDWRQRSKIYFNYYLIDIARYS